MSELRSVIESLRAEPLAELPDARVEDDFAELHAAIEALEAERLRRLGEIDRRRLFERDGQFSAVAWLTGRFGMSPGAACADVRTARALERMGLVRRALADGAISLGAVRVLSEARMAEPAAFAEAERFLIEAAARHPIPELRRAIVHWRHVVARDRAGEIGLAAVLRARRRLHASVTLEGMVRIDGDLDPETGETVLTALRAVGDAEARARLDGDRGADRGPGEGDPDDRTPAQRRADALGEICRSWLDRSDRPEVAGERPHLTVTVGLEALRSSGSREADLDDTGPLDPTGALEHTGAVDHSTPQAPRV